MKHGFRKKRGTFKRRKYSSRVSRGLKSLIPELQTLDTVNGATRFDSTGFYQLEFDPSRTATDYSNRIGSKTVIKSILVQGTFQAGTVQTAVSQHCRIVFFWDKQPNNAAPTSPLPLITMSPTSLMEPQFSNRFKILFDKDFCMSGVGGQVTPGSNEMHFKYYHRCNLVTRFSSNAGGIGDIVTGALYILFVGDTAPGTNSSPTFTWSTRVRFVQ